MNIHELAEQYEERKKNIEAIEHKNVLLAIKELLKCSEGKTLFKYLFKNLDVTCVPEGLEGNMLYEYLGFLKAGNSVYKLVSQADFKEAALILSEIERERHDNQQLEQYTYDTYDTYDTDE